MDTSRGSGDPALPDGRKRRLLIALDEIDQTIDDAAIMELAKIARSPANASLSRFAQNIRNDARLFIEAMGRLNIPKLREEIARLYGLTSRAASGGKATIQLARALEAMPTEVRDWLARSDHTSRNIPTAAEILSPATRTDAVDRLRLILSYGGVVEDGRKRPTGKRSRSFRSLLRVPASIKRGAPPGEAERDFVQNLALTYTELTGKKTPYTVHYSFEIRGPFPKFVHRCFELVGVPSGNVTRLINERGAVRRQIERRPPIDTNPFR
jgi:hypothetical protein